MVVYSFLLVPVTSNKSTYLCRCSIRRARVSLFGCGNADIAWITAAFASSASKVRATVKKSCQCVSPDVQVRNTKSPG